MLYLVYWGAAEPLGQSLVVPAVTRLAERGVRLTLVTFEKPADLGRGEEMARIEGQLAARGIGWIPLRYHKRPKWPATGFDVLHGCLRGLLARLRGPIDIVHARTFVGGSMGLVVACVLRARFVYHNEGFYPDEQVDGGVWQADSGAHRLAKRVENVLYAAANGIITLSHRGRARVEELPAVRRRGTPVAVVPSVVDLARFRPPPARAPADHDELRLVYIGSVGARYILDAVGRFVSVASRVIPRVRLRVLTHSAPARVEEMLGRAGLAREAWSAGWIPHADMPGELPKHHAGLFFLTQGLSEHGCSPTKIGEYWASGLPVVTTPNVSDTDEIVRRDRVGVIVGEHSEHGYRRAAQELWALLQDPGLPLRCRRAAESHYSLDEACARQIALYQQVMGRG